MKRVWIYDLEQWQNFHSGIFKDRDSNELKIFVIHTSRNDVIEYQKFLKEEVAGLIGFNSLNYDSQLIEMLLKINPDNSIYDILTTLHSISQEAINSNFPKIPEWELTIPQLDLYKIWHFDNKAKMTSLKSLQISMGYHNVEDLPHDANFWVKEEDIPSILDYNFNDVDSTELFYKITKGETELPLYKGKDKIQFRQDMKKLYKLRSLNFNDVKIGEEINKIGYLNLTGRKWYGIKDLKTPRSFIKVSDLIPSYIQFINKELITVLDKLKNLTINVSEPKFKYQFLFAENIWTLGLGGIHTKDKGRIVIPNNNQNFEEADVGSMYPNKIDTQELFPAHLGKEWLVNYRNNKNHRIKLKHLPEKTSSQLLEIETIKLALNGGGYGKTGEETNWQYDPMVKYTTTIQCQLDILMLADMLWDSKLLDKIESGNTDGINVLYNKNNEEQIHNIYRLWESITKAELEITPYSKLIRTSVNDYMAIKPNGSIKLKGDFEIEKELHKNNSQKIVQIAVVEYFKNNTPVRTTIESHTDILDFCKRYKATQGWYPVIDYINSDNRIQRDKLQKNIRYFVSHEQTTLLKMHNDGRQEHIEKGFTVTIFNRVIEKPMEDYRINYNYYVHEANKIINNVDNGQLSLF